tara:strand:+ start:11341 stop:12051 length:711 start_codon:yes stop_codon:yes gene_type:complete
MPARTIVQWPDKRLSLVSENVDPTSPETRMLARDLLDTMIAEFGLGLAAPQVGEAKSICVVKKSFASVSDLPEDPLLSDTIVLVNPVVTPIGSETFKWKEACLSVKGIEEEVSRHKKISLQYYNLAGEMKTLILEGQMSGVIQHETDHLIGKVFVDRLSSDKKRKVRSKIYSKKRKVAAQAKKELKRQKREEILERQQNEEPPRPGFRQRPKNEAKAQPKRKRRSKTFGKNKKRKR